MAWIQVPCMNWAVYFDSVINKNIDHFQILIWFNVLQIMYRDFFKFDLLEN